MARNYFVGFFGDQDIPWVDANGVFMKEPKPCIACDAPTHRYDVLTQGPVCDDGTTDACASKVWKVYEQALN